MDRLKGLAQFEGKWRLERQIDDRKSGVEGRLTGVASFTATEPGVLAYTETGELVYGDHPAMVAERRYTWREGKEQIDVFFEDGAPFHVIALGRLMPYDNHHCDPDLYHVSYDFTGWPIWRAVWRVIGPNKNYRMVSEYTALDA